MWKNKKTIALTWGSTWWHIFPLLSLHNYLKEEKKYKFIWVWEEWNLENEIAENNKIKFLDISAWKIRRYFDLRNLYEPLKNLTWITEWIYYIKKNKIDIIFSKGWYVSLPLAIAGKMMWKKIYIHESDTVSWISNRLVWKMANKIFYSFPNEKIDWKKHILSWQILNPELLDKIEDVNIIENQKLKVIVTWWSQGSTAIFENLLKILPELNDIEFHIILWEKNTHFKEKFDAYTNTKVYDFIEQKDLGLLLKNTDIAITRAWATSLWEQNVFGIHSIIIPLENSAWNHQNQNAIYFSKEFWSEIIKQDEKLAEKLKEKLLKYKNLRKSWLNLDNFYKPLQIIKDNIEK